ncbi:MAG: tetratricopeptide (TPR) repeat protein, partial [Salibacteraceae bacterium]
MTHTPNIITHRQNLKNYLITLLVIIGFFNTGFTQDWSRYGFKAYTERDYYGAAYYFDLALQNDSINMELIWYYANSERLSNEYKKAGIAFKDLMEKDEKVTYPEAVFYRADMLKRQEKYEEASVYFNFYRDVCKDKSNLFYRRAKNEINACLFAQSWQKMKSPVELDHPPFDLNSFDAEFSPQILNDSQMLFSSLRFDSAKTKRINVSSDQFKAFIYESELTENGWKTTALGPVINDSLMNN